MSFEQSGRDGLVGHFIDQDEGAGSTVRAIGVERERLRNAHGYPHDAVRADRAFRRDGRKCRDV